MYAQLTRCFSAVAELLVLTNMTAKALEMLTIVLLTSSM